MHTRPAEPARAPGGVGYLDERFVEYDLDSEDERWLGALNGGQDRLPPRRLESLIWRLELANAETTDRALAGAGAPVAPPPRARPPSVAACRPAAGAVRGLLECITYTGPASCSTRRY
jgi:hypothetical protein